MKIEMINKIKEQLKELGIETVENDKTDIEIKKEFLDAKFSGGSQKIDYHALAYINDEDKKVFFYELTSEISSGLSFGSSYESSFQSGMSLSRKIKSTRYGLNNEVIEVELNLGDISKVFKDVAKEYDYQFKVVLSKNKAMYPDPNKKSFFQSLFKK